MKLLCWLIVAGTVYASADAQELGLMPIPEQAYQSGCTGVCQNDLNTLRERIRLIADGGPQMTVVEAVDAVYPKMPPQAQPPLPPPQAQPPLPPPQAQPPLPPPVAEKADPAAPKCPPQKHIHLKCPGPKIHIHFGPPEVEYHYWPYCMPWQCHCGGYGCSSCAESDSNTYGPSIRVPGRQHALPPRRSMIPY